MTSATPRAAARHTHLVRATRSAGEAFGYTSADPSAPQRRGRVSPTLLWIGAGALAALGLFLSF